MPVTKDDATKFWGHDENGSRGSRQTFAFHLLTIQTAESEAKLRSGGMGEFMKRGLCSVG